MDKIIFLFIFVAIFLWLGTTYYIQEREHTPVIQQTFEKVETTDYTQGKLINTLTADRGERITETKYKLYKARLTTYNDKMITSIMEADNVDLEFETSKLETIKSASWYGNFKRRQYNKGPTYASPETVKTPMPTL